MSLEKILFALALLTSQLALADYIVIQPGTSVQVSARSVSTVSCAGAGGYGMPQQQLPQVLNCFCKSAGFNEVLTAVIMSPNGGTEQISLGEYSFRSQCADALKSNPRCRL